MTSKIASFVNKTVSGRDNMIKLLVIVVDLLLVILSYLIAFYVRFAGEPPEFNLTPFVQALPLVALAFLLYVDVFGLSKFYRKSRRSVFASILKLVFMQALTTTSITYFLQGFSFPRSVLLYAPLFQAALLTLWNWLMLALRDHCAAATYAMLIGGQKAAAAVMEKLSRTEIRRKMNVEYVFPPEAKAGFMRCLRNRRVDEVILCAELSEDLKMEILLLCMNLRKVVYLVPEVFEIALLNTRIVHLDDMPLLMLDRLSLSFEQRLFKRVFDLLVSLVALPLLLPFLLAAALAVKLSSPGKVFYSQDRVTAGGRVYRIYKFRTMYEGAEAATGPTLSSAQDARVTGAGRFLRRYRIDELPQLLNVLKGDMSLVGPRSERPFFVERYSRDIEGYDIRNNVKAGLTGYAQVFGNYDTSPEYKLKYDVLYIKNYSLLLDIKLILQTFNAILKKGSS
ncbi:MAG: sugar transferase [Clostridiales bacterium]|jgi:exopolysaccharide biosynthesis polyprenyl glycosylphosphotransferase|nr:sugar transferase [Clostridiales bacterium]